MVRRVPMTVGGSSKPVPMTVGTVSPLSMEISGGGGGGVNDYERLRNKPAINGVELVGDRPVTDFIGFGSELVYASKVLDVDVMTAQQVANLLTDD